MFNSQRNQAYLYKLLDWAKTTKQFGWERRSKLQEVEIGELNSWQESMNDFIQDIHRLDQPYSDEQIEEFEQRANHLYNMLKDLMAKKSSQPFSEAFKKEPQAQPQNQAQQPAIVPDHEMEVPKRSVPIGQHKLPPLPYAYNALEPYISEEIMRLHHDIHHQSYVDGLNQAERKMAEARRSGDYELLKHWEREAAFHGSGHYLHTIFWNVMSPDGGGRPSGELAQEINRSFGSFDQFKKHFSEAADKAEGVGWAILVWAPRAQRLEILQTEKHQLFAQWDVIPLLVLDVWEHAYYLQYKADRKNYIENWWNLVNWPYVQYRYNEAKKVRWYPY